MIAAWMIYALLVGVLVGGSALALESLLRAHRRPVRWVWAGAMGLSILWPLVHIIRDLLPEAPGAAPPPDPAWVVALDPLTVQVGPSSILHLLDGPLLWAWGVSSVVLLGLALLLLVRTHWLRKRWTGEEAGGQAVLLSEDWGPAVVGFLRPQIVLPAWCRELEEDALTLILDHEKEHLRAGDLPLLLSAAALPLLLPWHLPLWWQLARLRLGVEGDCDLRVLKKHPGRTRSYLELLLAVGSRPPRRQFAGAMLSEPEESLERRIRIMTMPFPKKPWTRALLLGSVGLLLVAVAFWAPGPMGAEEPDPAPSQATLQAVELPPSPEEIRAGTAQEWKQAAPSLQEGPVFTPYTVRPDIRNREDVARALEEEYPPLLRDAGIGGTVQIWFLIDETGTVQRTLINQTSGHAALDDAALRVAEVIEFTPALNRDKRVSVWISLPITFAVGGPGRESESVAPRQRVTNPESRELPPPPAARRTLIPDEITASPVFTPYTVRPDIKNRTDVARALEREYPPLLRDAGIGGTVHVWFFIDETGRTVRTTINQTSGHLPLDDAALRVAGIIEFTPALNKDKPAPVWISLPITFTVR